MVEGDAAAGLTHDLKRLQPQLPTPGPASCGDKRWGSRPERHNIEESAVYGIEHGVLKLVAEGGHPDEEPFG
jgi:hypothetical protein